MQNFYLWTINAEGNKEIVMHLSLLKKIFNSCTKICISHKLVILLFWCISRYVVSILNMKILYLYIENSRMIVLIGVNDCIIKLAVHFYWKRRSNYFTRLKSPEKTIHLASSSLKHKNVCSILKHFFWIKRNKM